MTFCRQWFMSEPGSKVHFSFLISPRCTFWFINIQIFKIFLISPRCKFWLFFTDTIANCAFDWCGKKCNSRVVYNGRLRISRQSGFLYSLIQISSARFDLSTIFAYRLYHVFLLTFFNYHKYLFYMPLFLSIPNSYRKWIAFWHLRWFESLKVWTVVVAFLAKQLLLPPSVNLRACSL